MSRQIEWHAGALDVIFNINEDHVISLVALLPLGADQPAPASLYFDDSALPVSHVRLIAEGIKKDKTSKALIGSYLSGRLRYQSHVESHDSTSYRLRIQNNDDSGQIKVTTEFTVHSGIPVLRSVSTIENVSNKEIIVSQLSSLTIGGLTRGSRDWWKDYSLKFATNSWFREVQWREHSLPSIGIDDNGLWNLPDGHLASMATHSLSNRGSFSTGTYLPMGMLKNHNDKDTWLWQIEHNGSWKWEIGDFKDGVYVAAGGPTGFDHDWKQKLAPGESFESVPVACCHIHDSEDVAFGFMNEYRRRIIRQHRDNNEMPIIFNDYMNCLMGDPDEDKIKALLEPVSKCGAEYFVIDAGWYADDSNWWDDVGLWQPSKKRFPSGFKLLMDIVRSKGLIPGVWLEPEVVGVRSIVAKQLPEDAFFQESGQRIVERGRYQLDYRHPEVCKRMHSIVDGLINDYGVGYFKFDYNIEVLQGSDVNTRSLGAAHLAHQRAYLAWVGELLDKHSQLVIESCSSGAQRMDYAMLAIHPMQSTSDQQDPFLYAAIAAAAPTAVIPEQSATWAYPQPSWDDETNAFTVVNALLGRVHLSGRLDALNSSQFDLVADGMRVYKSVRQSLRHARPVWPLGLPKWHDDWIALGMVCEAGDIYLAVWRRGGSTERTLKMPPMKTNHADIKLLYPSKLEAVAEWNALTSVLQVKLPNVKCARLFHITETN